MIEVGNVPDKLVLPEGFELTDDPGVAVGPDGVRYEIHIEGTADVIRGPLGRFIDLAAEIIAEGGEVPLAIMEGIAKAGGEVPLTTEE